MNEKIEQRIKDLDKLQKQIISGLKQDLSEWTVKSVPKPVSTMASAAILNR